VVFRLSHKAKLLLLVAAKLLLLRLLLRLKKLRQNQLTKAMLTTKKQALLAKMLHLLTKETCKSFCFKKPTKAQERSLSPGLFF
jgi:hypothetical protein